jgi:hypothetical protein
MNTILIVDDLKDEREKIVTLLLKLVSPEVDVISFTGEDTPEVGISYEHHIAEWITNNLGDRNLSLIACDKELGLYTNLRGLSASPVSSVASDFGIPFCLYSRQPKEIGRDFTKYQRLSRWSSEEITLDGTNLKEWVYEINAIFNGFKTIRERYEKVPRDLTPPAALATILGNPNAESRIALYGSGGQSFLLETLAFADQENVDIEELRKRMTRVFGNWLRLSILRFPGILVDHVSASSYLNIDSDTFLQDSFQEAISTAKYSGPFHELGNWWWRESLDSILEDNKVEDAISLANNLNLNPKQCLDPQNGTIAGYYCMITQTPVSGENSRSGISWFPSGADLARIRKDKFDQITALVGMY